jgi:hypothetical protein
MYTTVYVSHVCICMHYTCSLPNNLHQTFFLLSLACVGRLACRKEIQCSVNRRVLTKECSKCIVRVGLVVTGWSVKGIARGRSYLNRESKSS